ncbi:MAG: sulfite exporter TauE/SafE family protein [Chloroflexota bacterium]|nr:sulfite exporter TauE/SafE family protein [Chloroflexota bacterium]
MSIAIGMAIGLVAGLLGGMLGIGGGAILIPGMVLLLGSEQHTAQGVSLLVITLTALVGAITHYRQQTVRLGVAVWVIPAAIVFSFLGGMVADMLDTSLLRDVWGALLILVGIAMLATGRRSVTA